jgi:hypothetical protein
MITWFILGVCVLIALILAGRWFVGADPKKLAKLLTWGGLGLLGAVVLFFAVTGRLALAAPLLVFALWFLRRKFSRVPFGPSGMASNSPGSAGDGTSEVSTEYLNMTLNHESGQISGAVLKGRFEGRSLADLSTSEVVDLIVECSATDPQGAALLENFLDRTAGRDWRREFGQGESASGESARGGSTKMTREEALEILDLQEGAGTDDIRGAHHRLMLKLHPDQGGSTFLASQINQAKDLLLGL